MAGVAVARGMFWFGLFIVLHSYLGKLRTYGMLEVQDVIANHWLNQTFFFFFLELFSFAHSKRTPEIY